MKLHKATITLPLERMEIHIGLVATTMICRPFEVEVEYKFAPAAVPEDHDLFAVQAARLKQSLALHDTTDCMSLVISGNTDILQYLSARQLDWIEEHLPAPSMA